MIQMETWIDSIVNKIEILFGGSENELYFEEIQGVERISNT